MRVDILAAELGQLETETFEIDDVVGIDEELAGIATTSCSTSTSSTCSSSTSTSSTCGCSSCSCGSTSG